MSCNEIPNILVDSVVLSNKPLSNIEIIDAAKILPLYEFRGVFLRDALIQKEKLTECGIINLDSTSGDGTHWVIWLKKVRISFYSIVMVYSLLSELTAYLVSPIFYNSERVQQNGDVFCGHLCLFTLK